ncbi:hypothetical protein, partial [Thiolapillus sp.]
SAASRLLGSTSLRFALHGWQRLKALKTANKALVRTQTTLRFVCAEQLGRYASWLLVKQCGSSVK